MNYYNKISLLRFIAIYLKCLHITTRSVCQDAKGNERTMLKFKKIKYELTRSQGSLMSASH